MASKKRYSVQIKNKDGVWEWASGHTYTRAGAEKLLHDMQRAGVKQPLRIAPSGSI